MKTEKGVYNVTNIYCLDELKDFKDAESMYGILERGKIIEGVQWCFFKNTLILLFTINRGQYGSNMYYND